jgi:hypothetical protein
MRDRTFTGSDMGHGHGEKRGSALERLGDSRLPDLEPDFQFNALKNVQSGGPDQAL